jgi:glutaredoxin
MKNVVIYTKENCVWCVRAKELMNKLHITYEEKKLYVDYTKDDLITLLGRETNITVPQVFTSGKLIGGYDDLAQYVEDHGIMGLRS